MTNTTPGSAQLIATLPAVRRADPSPADRYMAAARGLFEGVKVLIDHTPYGSSACAFLAAQVVECALKAVISESRKESSGYENEVRGYNLIKLWIEAASFGPEPASRSR